MGLTYKDAGVDIDAGAALVDRIKPLAARTTRPEVLGNLGGFAGLCRLPTGYREPVLVSGTDGVGTKLMIALATGRHDTVGIDLVAMVVNDIAVTGAEPLFFLDYYATGQLDVDVAAAVVAGIASGCEQSGCALVGGETAELPGMYQGGDYDLAGFAVGVVERDDIRDGRDICAGDVLIGLPSVGVHSNGLSLARKVLLEAAGLGYDDSPASLGGSSVADELLRPTRIYVSELLGLAKAGVRFKAAAHITGGGLVENPPRMLRSDELAIELDTSRWEAPAIFGLIESHGVERAEMRRTFNMGIGMMVAVAADDVDSALSALGEDAAVIGRVVDRDGDDQVTFVDGSAT
jgi:phosphoribosylformylglycinamidine cyclo-ligase